MGTVILVMSLVIILIVFVFGDGGIRKNRLLAEKINEQSSHQLRSEVNGNKIILIHEFGDSCDFGSVEFTIYKNETTFNISVVSKEKITGSWKMIEIIKDVSPLGIPEIIHDHITKISG